MAHDVFISHAFRDKAFVVAICKSLESAQVKCWITERDISSGEDWTEATRNAIASSRLMVLVLSENANAAPHLESEIAHAFYAKRPILPVRITDTQPKRDFLFYLGNVHWVDAFNSSPEQYLQELTGRIRGILRSPIISRDIKRSPGMAEQARKKSPYQDSWMGVWGESQYGSLGISKRIAIGASLLAAIGLLWFFYSQVKLGQSPPGDDLQTLKDRTARAAAETGRTQTENSSAGNTEPDDPQDTIQGHADVLVPSPPVVSPSGVPSAESTPLEAESGGILKGSPEEQSLKELVLEYLRTMATNDSSALQRLLAGRVNFYGKGVLSFPEIEESMERYRRQWPIRKWESKGEPEFPNTLHSSDPNQYEVLQPFDWTVANGTKQKKGSAILYLRIRKAENGAFHIFHLEQRHV
jgi:TIR domain